MSSKNNIFEPPPPACCRQACQQQASGGVCTSRGANKVGNSGDVQPPSLHSPTVGRYQTPQRMKTGSLVYISIPEHLQGDFSGHKDFAFNPAIPLPVELPPQNFPAPDIPDPDIPAPDIPATDFSGSRRFDPGSLTVEMIVSGILLDLAENPGGENSAYYRNLAAAVMPNLAAGLEEAAVIKAEIGDDEAAREILRLLDGLLGQNNSPNRKAADLLSKSGKATADGEATVGGEAFEEAIALISKGSEDQGILKAKEFLERHPGSGKGWFVLGWGLRRLSRWEDAAACFEKAIELGCGNADVRNELAICCMETGNLEDARRELEKALRTDPENVKIISNMGILAMKQGDHEKAAAFFRTVLELEPDDPIAGAYFRRRKSPHIKT